MTSNIRDLLANIINTAVAGDNKSTEAAIRQAIQQKSVKYLRERSLHGQADYIRTNEQGDAVFGNFDFSTTVAGNDRVPAGTYYIIEATASIEVAGRYRPATRYEPEDVAEVEWSFAGATMVPVDGDGEETGSSITLTAQEAEELLDDDVRSAINEDVNIMFSSNTGFFAPEVQDGFQQ